MQFLGPPFCSVCVEATVERIHSLVTPVESYEPQNITIAADTFPTKFKLSLIAPEPNTLRRTWTLNGILFKQNVDSVLINENMLSDLNTLRVTIEDTTHLLRVDNHASIHISVVTWSNDTTISGIKQINGYTSEVFIDLYPNPTSDYLNVKWGGIKGDIRFDIFDMKGQRMLTKENVNSINLQNLSNGIYLVKIYIDNDLITTRKIIKE
jgi:hypothetical protein